MKHNPVTKTKLTQAFHWSSDVKLYFLPAVTSRGNLTVWFNFPSWLSLIVFKMADLLSDINEASEALDCFFDNRITQCMDILNAKTSLYHSLGLSAARFMYSVLTFDRVSCQSSVCPEHRRKGKPKRSIDRSTCNVMFSAALTNYFLLPLRDQLCVFTEKRQLSSTVWTEHHVAQHAARLIDTKCFLPPAQNDMDEARDTIRSAIEMAHQKRKTVRLSEFFWGQSVDDWTEEQIHGEYWFIQLSSLSLTHLSHFSFFSWIVLRWEPHHAWLSNFRSRSIYLGSHQSRSQVTLTLIVLHLFSGFSLPNVWLIELHSSPSRCRIKKGYDTYMWVDASSTIHRFCFLRLLVSINLHTWLIDTSPLLPSARVNRF